MRTCETMRRLRSCEAFLHPSAAAHCSQSLDVLAQQHLAALGRRLPEQTQDMFDMFELVSLSLTWFALDRFMAVKAAVRQLEEANTQLNVAALGQRLGCNPVPVPTLIVLLRTAEYALVSMP